MSKTGGRAPSNQGQNESCPYCMAINRLDPASAFLMSVVKLVVDHLYAIGGSVRQCLNEVGAAWSCPGVLS